MRTASNPHCFPQDEAILEGHPITMVSKYNLRSPLENPLATGRTSAWAMELQGFGLKFEQTDNIKSQALADFTAEWTETAIDGPEEETSLPKKEDPDTVTAPFW